VCIFIGPHLIPKCRIFTYKDGALLKLIFNTKPKIKATVFDPVLLVMNKEDEHAAEGTLFPVKVMLVVSAFLLGSSMVGLLHYGNIILGHTYF